MMSIIVRYALFESTFCFHLRDVIKAQETKDQLERCKKLKEIAFAVLRRLFQSQKYFEKPGMVKHGLRYSGILAELSRLEGPNKSHLGKDLKEEWLKNYSQRQRKKILRPQIFQLGTENLSR